MIAGAKVSLFFDTANLFLEKYKKRGCIKIENAYHSVTPSIVEGSHVILISHYVRCLDKLDMTDYTLMK